MKKIFTIVLMSVLSLMVGAVDVTGVLSEIKQSVAPDKRTAVWDVESIEQNDTVVLIGTVGTTEQLHQLNEALVMRGVSNYVNHVTVLEQTLPCGRRNGIVKLAVASLRCEGKHSAEMATQAGMGTPVRVIEQCGDWLRVQLPDDYIAYIPESSLSFKSADEMLAWRKSKRCVVTAMSSILYADVKGEEQVSDLVLSNILEYKGEKGDFVHLATPDGRTGWVKKSDVEMFDKWASQTPDVKKIESVARKMMGAGYLWGGTSTKVTDCSGLMKVSYMSNGIILQRDASQQALTGRKIADRHSAERGDLLFFGNSRTGRVTHVGMYLEDGKYIHCSGQVKINSLDPEAEDYLYSPLSISRVLTEIGTNGIVLVRDHSWYF